MNIVQRAWASVLSVKETSASLDSYTEEHDRKYWKETDDV